MTIEISLPESCGKTISVDVCEDLKGRVFIAVKRCSNCAAPFIPVRQNHRFCYRPGCRLAFHRKSEKIPA